MDPAIVVQCSPLPPLMVDQRMVVAASPFLPLQLPLAWLPPEARARLLLSRADMSIAARVAAALAVGMDREAWALVVAQNVPPSADVRLDRELRAWIDRHAHEFDLPTQRGAVVVLGADPRRTHDLTNAALAEIGDVDRMLAALPVPRWSGPLIVVCADTAAAGLSPGERMLSRPAAPVIRLPLTANGELLAAAICRLELSLCNPPVGGWPDWLDRGLAQVASAKARGEGPSPLKMLGIRQQSGIAGIRALFTGRGDDALAEAVCAPLVYSKRQHLLANLLDLLRNGVDAERALAIAYDFSLERLIEER